MVTCCVVSDIHCYDINTPPAEVLICCGDMTLKGNQAELEWFDSWLQKQPQRIKLYVPGNHDLMTWEEPERARNIVKSAHWLVDSGVDIDNLHFYGSPWTHPAHSTNWAFPLKREDSEEHWSKLPGKIDVLITHSPPFGILDKHYFSGINLGDRALREAVHRLSPPIHCYGHVHEGYGVEWSSHNTYFVNASICNESYRPLNRPYIFDTKTWKIERWYEEEH